MDQTKVFTKHKNFLDQTYLIKSRSTSSLRGSKKDCLPIVWTLHVLQVFVSLASCFNSESSNRLIIVLTIRWDRAKRNKPLKYFKTVKLGMIFLWKLIFTHVVPPSLHLGSKSLIFVRNLRFQCGVRIHSAKFRKQF